MFRYPIGREKFGNQTIAACGRNRLPAVAARQHIDSTEPQPQGKGRVNYRILYFFYGRSLAIPGHALTKENEAPKADIEREIRRKRAFEADPSGHSYSEEEEK